MEDQKKTYGISALTYLACAFFAGLSSAFKQEGKFKIFYGVVAAVFLAVAVYYVVKYWRART